jgi:phage terminase small subunit
MRNDEIVFSTPAIEAGDTLSLEEEAYADARARGLPPKQAARAACIPIQEAKEYEKQPNVVYMINTRRKLLREEARITRDDVIDGFMEAIRQAKLLGDPSTQIAGWREIGKMLGYYEPERRVIQLSDRREEALAQLQAADTEQLLRLVGPDGVIEAEFDVVTDAA